MRSIYTVSLLVLCSAGYSQSLKVEDALGLFEFAGRSPIGISPQGEYVAYTVEDTRRHQSMGGLRYETYSPTGAYREADGDDVWIVDMKSGESKNLTEGKGCNWGPAWSPDGKYLAFYSDRSGTAHLWVWEKSSGNLRQLSDAIVRASFLFNPPRWTPDSRRIVVKVLPAGMTVEQAADLATPQVKTPSSEPGGAATVTVLSFNPASKAEPEKKATTGVLFETWMNRYMGEFALIDVASGKAEYFASGYRPLGSWISPDGKYLAFTSWRGMEPNTQQTLYELVVVSLADKSVRVLSSEVKQQYGISVSWSPDSRTLAYTTYGQKAAGDCFIVPVSGGPAVNLTPGSHPPVGSAYQTPLWDSAGKWIYLASGGKAWKISPEKASLQEIGATPGRTIREIALLPGGQILAETSSSATKQCGFYKIDPATGAATNLMEENQYLIGAFDLAVHPGDGSVAYIAQDAQRPHDIWLASKDFHDRRRLTKINPHAEGIKFGESRLIEWNSVDGVPLHGGLLLPSNYEPGKRYPLIVKVYGGSNLSDGTYRFGLAGASVENMQILATRGYAVLTPDAPQRIGSPMRDLMKTVMPGVDKVVEMGIADPKRLGVMGHSYGGYSTLSLIVQTNRFRAAVDSAGPADLLSNYGALDAQGGSFAIGWSETGQSLLGGNPWQYRDRYIENSPWFYLDRVETPLLIVHGALDRAVPAWQADAVFAGLRRLGKEVVYAKYAGESHWEGAWSYANALDYCNRMIQWFDDHLK